ncbi:unnamed protein product [Linum trigynum]|uniref:Secreted protein n=1 Tax=Linum trigynum TaxID=586398 RepID=A0AAV2CFH0_9ROSI
MPLPLSPFLSLSLSLSLSTRTRNTNSRRRDGCAVYAQSPRARDGSLETERCDYKFTRSLASTLPRLSVFSSHAPRLIPPIALKGN